MKKLKDSERIEAETERLLNDVLAEAIRQSRPVKRFDATQRGLRFGVGLLLLAPFCVSIAAFTWVQSDPMTSAIWLCFALALLFVGGWSFDKAGKEADAAKTVSQSNPTTKPSHTADLRRVHRGT